MNWEQFKAIVWLRFRLSRNQFIRAGQLNAALSIVLLAFLFAGAAGAAVTGLVLGPTAGHKASPEVLLLICDVSICIFLFIWMMGVVIELQRSESIDLDRLLHLPISLQQVFAFNYLASHFAPSVILFVPGIIGFCFGLIIGAGWKMAPLLPLFLSFIFVITAWTYCLRGWLAGLMLNKRRRRAIIVWVTAIFILIGQLPNLLFHAHLFRSMQNQAEGSPTSGHQAFNKAAFMAAHRYVPPGWVGYGAMELRQSRIWPALGATVVCCLTGVLGLRRAYRLTIRLYVGTEGAAAAPMVEEVTAAVSTAKPRRMLLVERPLPFVPDDVAGLTLAMFRSYSRAPELKLALLMPVIFGAVGVSLVLARTHNVLPGPFREILATVAVFMATFFLAPTMANSFGLDRNGFRALVLLPTRRDYILLAKNLAFLPFVAITSSILAILLATLTHAPLQSLLTALLLIPAGFLLICFPCNLTSILTPFRLAQGSLKAKRPKALVILVILLNMFLEPFVVAPILLAPALQLLFTYEHWMPWLPVDILAAFVILLAAGVLYRLLLPAYGRLLQRREQIILREVTEEVE